MAAPMKAGLPPDCTLSSGYTIRLVGLDASGNLVTGINLSAVSFFVTDLLNNPAAGPDQTPQPLLVPLSDLA